MATERPLCSFVQLNDVHVQSEAGKKVMRSYPHAEAKLAAVVKAVNEESPFPLPDFVLSVGDLIQGERLELLEPDLRVYAEMVRPLKCPHLTVVGNHEVVQREGDPRFEAAYAAVFGADQKNYLFTCGGVLFVVVNNCGGRGAGDAVSDARNAWLAKALETHTDAPVIVACHVPLVCVRDEKVLAESFGFHSYVAKPDGTLRVIERHADRVIAVLCGHLHLTGVVAREGIRHICPCGTASYPSHYAHYRVFRDRVEVAMHQPPADLVGPRDANNLHGRPRYKKDYTDAAHPTAETYVAGNPAEQRFTIPLPPAKRPQPAALGSDLRVLKP